MFREMCIRDRQNPCLCRGRPLFPWSFHYLLAYHFLRNIRCINSNAAGLKCQCKRAYKLPFPATCGGTGREPGFSRKNPAARDEA